MQAEANAAPSMPAGLTLTPLERKHLARTRAWANEPELMRLLNRHRTVTESEHARWFDDLRQATDRRYFAVESDSGWHLGNVWLWQIDPQHRKAEVRIVIGDPASQGRGLGSRAIELVAELAFATLDLHRLVAYVLAINPRARRAFETAGFRVEGILAEDRWIGDRYCDVFALGRLRPAARPS